MALGRDERTTLIALTVGAITMTILTLCLVKAKNRRELILNNRIHVIQAGGNFEHGFLETYEKQKNLFGNFDSVVLEPHINSGELEPGEWNGLVAEIDSKYRSYDAFVIVVGRSTLAYTASALSFMLENLGKPVILVDEEVAPAIKVASSTRIPEVMVFSDGNLIRGCKAVPWSTSGFSSPNYPALTEKTCLRPPSGAYIARGVNPKSKVIVVRMFPGIDAKYINNTMAKEMPNAIVFQMYGLGYGPTNDDFLGVITMLAKKGVVMVSVSQVEQMNQPYEANDRFIAAGILDGRDMTTEAAFAKIHYLLANVEDRKLIGSLMSQNLRGEMVLPE